MTCSLQEFVFLTPSWKSRPPGMQAENEASTRAQPLYGARPMTSPTQDMVGRPVHAQGYRYTPPQGSQAQMHPLLSDYAGMQYPGY